MVTTTENITGTPRPAPPAPSARTVEIVAEIESITKARDASTDWREIGKLNVRQRALEEELVGRRQAESNVTSAAALAAHEQQAAADRANRLADEALTEKEALAEVETLDQRIAEQEEKKEASYRKFEEFKRAELAKFTPQELEARRWFNSTSPDPQNPRWVGSDLWSAPQGQIARVEIDAAETVIYELRKRKNDLSFLLR